jgi:hypothetical protein
VLRPEEIGAAAQVCRRLDGLPLAIELAAARCRVVLPSELLARLGHRLPLLSASTRDLPPRHRTLRQAISWSEELLEPPVRAAFRRLGVFAGGWTVEAAAAVAVSEPDSAGDTIIALGHLKSLVEQSLVEGSEGDAPGTGDDRSRSRYVMLETIREYALERLAAAGEETVARRRHATFFTALAERAEPEIKSPRAATWLDRLRRDFDNVRAALDWCIGSGDPDLGLRLFGALLAYWYLRGGAAEAHRWLGALMALPGAPASPARVQALNTGAIVAWGQGDAVAALAAARAAAEAGRATGDRRGTVFARIVLLAAAGAAGLGEQPGCAPEDVLAEARASGDVWLDAFAATCVGIGAARRRQGRALPLLRAGLEGFRISGDPWGVAEAAVELGQLLLGQGQAAAAAEIFAEGATAYGSLDHRRGIARCLAGTAGTSTALGDPVTAARLLGQVEAMLAESGGRLEGEFQADLDRHISATRARLTDSAFASALAEGQAEGRAGVPLGTAMGTLRELPPSPSTPDGA